MNEKSEGGSKEDHKDWKAPKDFSDLVSQIPEAKLVRIEEKEIPPPAEGVSLEEELATYRKWAKRDWQDKEKVDEENTVREKQGYVSPRTAEGKIDWPKVWKMLEQECPKREEVFPNGEDKDLSDYEIETRLNQYFSDHKIPLWSLTGIDANEFPEIIDEDMRKVCLEANKEDWIRTKEGCTGHRENIKENGTKVLSNRGFQNPYLAVYLDRADSRSREFEDELNMLIEELKKKYPFVRGGVDDFGLTDSDLEENDIKTLHVGLAIDPSGEWKDKIKQQKGDDFFDDVQIHPDKMEDEIILTHPKKPEEYSDEQSFVEDFARLYRIFNYQRSLWHKYQDRYQEKFGEFFRSDEAENISKEFFASIQRIIDMIKNNPNPIAR